MDIPPLATESEVLAELKRDSEELLRVLGKSVCPVS